MRYKILKPNHYYRFTYKEGKNLCKAYYLHFSHYSERTKFINVFKAYKVNHNGNINKFGTRELLLKPYRKNRYAKEITEEEYEQGVMLEVL